MANYYTRFSFIVTMPSAEQAKAALDLLDQFKSLEYDLDLCDPDDLDVDAVIAEAVENGEPLSEAQQHVLQDLKDFGQNPCGVCAQLEDDQISIWFAYDESGDVEATVAFIELCMDRFSLEGPVTFEWSNTCSKPRTDAFGGGAVVITKGETFWHNTTNWISETLKQLESAA
jgi:hypothetical protein